VSNMSSESRTSQTMRDSAFQLLCSNHSFLSYISALGAHRDKIDEPQLLALLDDTVCYVEDVLQTDVVSDQQAEEMRQHLTQRIGQLAADADTRAPLVLQQLGLLVALMPDVARLRRTLNTY